MFYVYEVFRYIYDARKERLKVFSSYTRAVNWIENHQLKYDERLRVEEVEVFR